MAGGIELALRVTAGAGRTRIVGRYGNRLKCQVSAPPERGRANEMVRALLARALGVRRGDVEIVSGHASPDKLVLVRGVSPGELASWETSLEG